MIEAPVKTSSGVFYNTWLASIQSTLDLDGGGSILAPVFKELLDGKKFNTAFEWCAGPAWIGMWLLENGICETLVTGDINEKTVNFVKESANKHSYNIRAYHSDNLNQIPESEKFDLVIANPPNYCNIQETHPLGYLRYNLRPSDVDWKIHKDFYKSIGRHLNENAVMFISEVAPYSKEVYVLNELYDKRPDMPIQEFYAMTEDNNLKIIKEIPYNKIFSEFNSSEFCMLEIVKFN